MKKLTAGERMNRKSKSRKKEARGSPSKRQGSISVFFAMTFFAILALLFGMLELSRVYALKTNAYEKSELAVISAYSNYAAELADEFNLLFFWEDEETLEDSLSFYAKKQLGEKNSLLKLSFPSVSMEEKAYATDEGGIYFLKQVADVTPYRVGGEAIGELLNLKNLKAQMAVVTNFTDILQGGQDTLEKVGDALQKLKMIVEEIKKYKASIENIVSGWQAIIQDIENFQIVFEEEPETENDDEKVQERVAQESETAWDELKKCFDDYREQLDDLLTEIEGKISDALDAMEKFEKLEKDAKKLVESLDDFLATWKNSLPSNVYSGLKEQVDDIRETFTVTDNDSYGRKELKSGLENVKKAVHQVNEKIMQKDFLTFDDIKEQVKDKVEEEIRNYFYELAEEWKEEIISEVESLAGQMVSLVFKEKSYGQGKDSGLSRGLIDQILDLMNNGVLSLVLDDVNSISGNVIDTDDLPSTTSVSTGSEQTNFLKNEWNRLLMACYNGLYFRNYLDTSSEDSLKYEMEYILGGSRSDKENLEKVMGNIFLVREGLNIAYLLTDSEKMDEAGTAALALASAIGLPILKIPLQLLIVAAWAAGEAVYDLRCLYSGESIPLIKTKDTWQLSLSNLSNFGDKSIAGGNGQNNSSKSLLSFDYKTYLLLLYLLQDGKTQTYRMMDMVQKRMQETVNSEFCMSKCVAEGSGVIQYQSTPLFAGTWVTGHFSAVPANYDIKTDFSYGYTTGIK